MESIPNGSFTTSCVPVLDDDEDGLELDFDSDEEGNGEEGDDGDYEGNGGGEGDNEGNRGGDGNSNRKKRKKAVLQAEGWFCNPHLHECHSR